VTFSETCNETVIVVMKRYTTSQLSPRKQTPGKKSGHQCEGNATNVCLENFGIRTLCFI